MNNQIFWLASYPKSGNTLLRSMLISLFFTKDCIFELKKAYQIEQFERTKHLERNKELFNNEFDKLVVFGLTINYFFYFLINISMVIGLVPVVGVPLPIISYGGSSMLAIIISFAIIQKINLNRKLIN